MIEVQLDPSTGLKQSVDYPFTITFPADRAIQNTDTARMELRFALDDALPVDTLTIANTRLSMIVDGAGVAALPNSGQALLVNSMPPRMVYRHTDGTLYYGPPYSATP